jgi:hypothetical protein
MTRPGTNDRYDDASARAAPPDVGIGTIATSALSTAEHTTNPVHRARIARELTTSTTMTHHLPARASLLVPARSARSVQLADSRTTEATVGDKSPQKKSNLKQGKSLKEKRVDKAAKKAAKSR